MEDVVPPRLTEGGLVVSSPLASLSSDKLRIIKVENVAVGTRTERTLADITGPGSVKSLWMALGGGNGPALDARLRVYYDGAGTPAVDIDMGTLLATHFGAARSPGRTHSPRSTSRSTATTTTRASC
jgi:hypothetical protein